MKIIDSTNLGYLISKIKAAFWSKSDVIQISIDSTPTANSTNLVTSGGVYSAIPSVPTISTDISADATSDVKTASPKAVKTYVDSNLSGMQNYYNVALSSVTNPKEGDICVTPEIKTAIILDDTNSSQSLTLVNDYLLLESNGTSPSGWDGMTEVTIGNIYTNYLSNYVFPSQYFVGQGNSVTIIGVNKLALYANAYDYNPSTAYVRLNNFWVPLSKFVADSQHIGYGEWTFDQDYYTYSLSYGIDNPQEGDISVISDYIVATISSYPYSTNQNYNNEDGIRIKCTASSVPSSDISDIEIYKGPSSSWTKIFTIKRDTAGISIYNSNNDIVATFTEANQYFDLTDFWDYNTGYYKLEETTETNSLSDYLEISSVKFGSVYRYSNGAWIKESLYNTKIPVVNSCIQDMLPNIYYRLGEISDYHGFYFNKSNLDYNIVNHWFFSFTTGSTAPSNVAWDSSITVWQGGSAPTLGADKIYNVSVIDGCAVIAEFDKPTT